MKFIWSLLAPNIAAEQDEIPTLLWMKTARRKKKKIIRLNESLNNLTAWWVIPYSVSGCQSLPLLTDVTKGPFTQLKTTSKQVFFNTNIWLLGHLLYQSNIYIFF